MRSYGAVPVVLVSVLAVGAIGAAPRADQPPQRPVNGTIWAANRGAHSIRGFDPGTGAVIGTVAMGANSQPGDLAYAKGRIYVAEEFGTPPAIAIVDPGAGIVVHRIVLPPASRPHHVHASASGNLVAVGLFGTDRVAVVDTHDDALLGLWDSNTATTNGRVHAAVFSNDGNTLYLADEGANEVVSMDPRNGLVLWRMPVPGVHELAVTHDGKTAFVTRRSANTLSAIDLEQQTLTDLLVLPLPDTLQLSADEQLLTVGLRTMPAQLAVVDTRTLAHVRVILSAPGEAGTIAGHQWTSPSGRLTFASFEGGTNPGIAVVDHSAGHTVVQRLAYPGRPHGVDHVRP